MAQQELILEKIIESLSNPNRKRLEEEGTWVGRLYTDKGLPLDMSIAELRKRNFTEDDIFIIVEGALTWFVQHKRNSGATDKALNRQREQNSKTMSAFLAGRETGLY